MKHTIGYAASLGEKDIVSAMKFAVQNGLNAVELNMNMPCFFPEEYDVRAIRKIVEFKNKNCIELTMHAPEDISLVGLHEGMRLSGIERLKDIMAFAAEIEVSRITVHTNSTPYFTLVDGKGYVQDEYECHAVKNLKDSLESIMEYRDMEFPQISICIENSGYFPKYIQRTLEYVMDEYELYLTWDIGHSYTDKYFETSFFRKNIDRVRVCHLHDHNGKSDHQIIGTGSVQFREHMELMGSEKTVYIIEVRPRQEAAKSFVELKKILESR